HLAGRIEHPRKVLGADHDQRHDRDDREFRPADVEHALSTAPPHGADRAKPRSQLFAVSSRCTLPAGALPCPSISRGRLGASVSSSSSFRPDLKLFTPLAMSPITRGSLPAPNRMRTISRTTRICQTLIPIRVISLDRREVSSEERRVGAESWS